MFHRLAKRRIWIPYSAIEGNAQSHLNQIQIDYLRHTETRIKRPKQTFQKNAFKPIMLTALNPSPIYYNQLEQLKAKKIIPQDCIYPSPLLQSIPCPESNLVGPCYDVPGRKRKSKPYRSYQQLSTSEEKYLEGVIKLDVYAQYLSNPSVLLLNTVSVIKQVQPRPNPISPKKPKTLDLDLPKLDLSSYRNTKNAPQVVWKKGFELINIRRYLGN